MKTVTYQQIKLLVGDLAGRPRDKLPTSEAAMLRTLFAAELPDLWNKEAWPELCDHVEAIALDATGCFSLRETTLTEMGDILAIIQGGDPRITNAVTVLPRNRWTRLNGRVNVLSDASGGLWVDWQTPPTNLLAATYDTETTLNALTLPERFLLPLTARGAALLIAEENPTQAAICRALADTTMKAQAANFERPWWRQ